VWDNLQTMSRPQLHNTCTNKFVHSSVVFSLVLFCLLRNVFAFYGMIKNLAFYKPAGQGRARVGNWLQNESFGAGQSACWVLASKI
jgi:hypothetical protein